MRLVDQEYRRVKDLDKGDGGPFNSLEIFE
jgi:hypothetical protein